MTVRNLIKTEQIFKLFLDLKKKDWTMDLIVDFEVRVVTFLSVFFLDLLYNRSGSKHMFKACSKVRFWETSERCILPIKHSISTCRTMAQNQQMHLRFCFPKCSPWPAVKEKLCAGFPPCVLCRWACPNNHTYILAPLFTHTFLLSFFFSTPPKITFSGAVSVVALLTKQSLIDTSPGSSQWPQNSRVPVFVYTLSDLHWRRVKPLWTQRRIIGALCHTMCAESTPF